MQGQVFSKFTVVYSCESSFQVRHEVIELEVKGDNRVEIPDSFKEGRIIMMVCAGDVSVLNRLGDSAFELVD